MRKSVALLLVLVFLMASYVNMIKAASSSDEVIQDSWVIAKARAGYPLACKRPKRRQ